MTRANLVLGALLVGALVLALARDGTRPWRADGVVQISTPWGAVDRCPTCHRGALPGATAKAHPAVQGHADLTRFGCTACHGGQGRRLDRQAHAPRLGGGVGPFVTGPRAQARCARCHVPTDLAGAKRLHRGFMEYLHAGCNGCHHPGRRDEGLGPDLRRMGRRTATELREALLSPRQSHDGSIMWSLTRRYRKGGDPGPEGLEALVVALLAMGEPTGLYREGWARPGLRVDVDCTGCHAEVSGGKTGGTPHRCSLLRRDESLRCRRCHGTEQTRVDRRPGQECPQVRAARPLCAVCHLRPGNAAP